MKQHDMEILQSYPSAGLLDLVPPHPEGFTPRGFYEADLFIGPCFTEDQRRTMNQGIYNFGHNEFRGHVEQREHIPSGETRVLQGVVDKIGKEMASRGIQLPGVLLRQH